MQSTHAFSQWLVPRIAHTLACAARDKRETEEEVAERGSADNVFCGSADDDADNARLSSREALHHTTPHTRVMKDA